MGQIRVQTLPTGQGVVTLPFSDVTQEYTLVVEATTVNTVGTSVRITGAEGAALHALQTAAAPAGVAADAPIRRMERELLGTLPRRSMVPRSPGLIPADEDEEGFWVVNTVGSVNLQDQTDFDFVNAFRRFNGTHVQIYVDERANASISDAQINAIGSEFDTQTFQTDVGAFGDVSDIDGNGKVIILLSPTVNAMTTPEITAQGARIIGFFFGIDLIVDATFNPHGNSREIFYAVVPNDPGGGTPFAGAKVTSGEYVPLMGSVFAHEFQHMINFNEHVLERNAPLEETWLDEGLAHMAEALNGYTGQNRLRSAFFLDSPSEVALVGDGDGLDERGASFLFVQYLVDRFGENVLGKLVQTSQVGMANVGTASGRTFATLFHEWAAALLLDGPEVSNDAIFEFGSLDLRSDFASAKAQLGDERIPGTFLDQRSATVGSGSTFVNQKGTSAFYVKVTSSAEGNVPITVAGQATAGLQVSIIRTR